MSDAMKTIIIDYGLGNLRSVEKALESMDENPVVSPHPDVVRKAKRLILPGVGAFGDAMENLRRTGMDAAIREAVAAGAPLLGLCLGLQLLFTHSEEFGSHQGLDLIPGNVTKLDAPGLRVPHVGWNQLENIQPTPLLEDIPEGSYFYFVHSFYVTPVEETYALSRTDYGQRFCSIAGKDNVFGVQFHPEKSQDNGKKLLRNFLNISR